MSGHPLDASVTLDEILSVVGARRVPLAAELVGYLLLELAERMEPRSGEIDLRNVFVNEEGAVSVLKTGRGTTEDDVEASLRSVLGRLLEASSSQAPALTAAAKRTRGVGLSGFAEELETALIPVNRAAGRRALGRLARETRKVTLVAERPRPVVDDSNRKRTPRPPQASAPAGHVPDAPFARDEEATTARRPVPQQLPPPSSPASATDEPGSTRISQADVDALIEQFGVSSGGDKQHARALGSIVGLEPTPAPPGAPGNADVPGALVARDSDIESLLSMGSFAPPAREGPAPVSPAEPALRRPLPPLRAPLPSLSDRPRSRGSWALATLAMVAVAAGAYVIYQMRGSLTPHAIPAPTPVPSTAPAPIPTACSATLVITAVPPRAEVLLGEGQAPADVEKMPVGARLEFVATAEGYAPKRVVVPAGQAWDSGPDGKPRYEAAVQLDKSRARSGEDNWPPGEPGTEVGGQGPPGTVHVVATPRGAEIWMLAGLGPEARIERLACDRDWDVLVAGPTTFRKTVHVPASSFVVEPKADLGGSQDGPSAPSKAVERVARVRGG